MHRPHRFIALVGCALVADQIKASIGGNYPEGGFETGLRLAGAVPNPSAATAMFVVFACRLVDRTRRSRP